MRKLIWIEWLKIRKYRAFWILLGLYALAVVCICYALFSLQTELSTKTAGQMQLNMFQAPYLWNTTAWLASFALVLPGFLIIFLLANEFSFKTFRQQIISGIQRTEAIWAKWLLSLAIAVFCWLIYFGTTLIIGWTGGQAAVLFTGFHFAGYLFLKILLALSVAFVIALWIKRSGLAIALFLVYYLLVEGILSLVLNRFYRGLGDFLPLNSAASLIPSPFERMLPVVASGPSDSWLVLVALGWLVVFIVLSVRYIRVADL